MLRECKLVTLSSIALLALGVSFGCNAQHGQHDHSTHNSSNNSAQNMDHHIEHEAHNQMTHSTNSALPTAAGQAGFAAIQEILLLLESDPSTDWDSVNIDALREHLVDMNRVMMATEVQAQELENGMRYHLSGDADTLAAIKRMVPAHAREMRTSGTWGMSVSVEPAAVLLEITSAEQQAVVKIRALGFAGFMAMGEHHQRHHWQMATGGSHH